MVEKDPDNRDAWEWIHGQEAGQRIERIGGYPVRPLADQRRRAPEPFKSGKVRPGDIVVDHTGKRWEVCGTARYAAPSAQERELARWRTSRTEEKRQPNGNVVLGLDMDGDFFGTWAEFIEVAPNGKVLHHQAASNPGWGISEEEPEGVPFELSRHEKPRASRRRARQRALSVRPEFAPGRARVIGEDVLIRMDRTNRPRRARGSGPAGTFHDLVPEGGRIEIPRHVTGPKAMADWAGNDPDRLFGALVSARSRKAYVQRLSDDQLRRLYGRLYAGPGSPGFTTRETSRELQRRGLTP